MASYVKKEKKSDSHKKIENREKKPFIKNPIRETIRTQHEKIIYHPNSTLENNLPSDTTREKKPSFVKKTV